MTFEKRQPLPPGRYWIDVIGPDKTARFASTLALGAAHGITNVEASESWTPGILEDGEPQTWFLFTVNQTDFLGRKVAGLEFDTKEFGFPTIATAEIQAKDDTVQKPPDPTDTLIPAWAKMVGLVVAAVGGTLYLIKKIL
jgi:hypothetical protein